TAVRGTSPSEASNVTMTDPLPVGFTYTSSTASQGSCGFASGLLTCNLGLMLPNTSALITVSGNVTTDSVQLNNTSTVTRSETDSYLANNSSSSQVLVLAPTLAQMRTMEAIQTPSGVTVAWQTSLEVDNLGFNVHRAVSGGPLVKLNEHLIRGSAMFSRSRNRGSSGFSYRFKDVPPAGALQYYIEDIDLRGIRTMNGPIVPRIGNADDIVLETTEPDPAIGSAGGVIESPRGLGLTTIGRTGPLAARQNQQLQIAAQNAGKIVVPRAGWMRVTKSDLVAGGYDPGTSSRALAVFADGIEVPVEVNDGGDGRFDANDTIEFFATGNDTPTSGTRIYYVVNDKGTGVRVKSNNGNGKGSAGAKNFTYTYSRDERFIYFAALVTNGDGENFVGTVVTSDPAVATFPIENLDTSGQTAEIEIALQGGVENFDHSVSVKLNGNEIGPVQFRGVDLHVHRKTVPLSWLVNGENRLDMVGLNGWESLTAMNSLRVTYPHLYRADDNALMLSAAPGTEVRISGFTEANVKAVDLTDEYAPLRLAVKNGSASDGSTEAVVVAPQGSKTRTILVYGDSRVVVPAQVVANQPSSWTNTKNAADLVIISHRDFLTAANALKKAREAEGIATAVVDVQNLYDEFTFGERGPQAIRAFLEKSQSWTRAPKYAILLGDASFDPRNYMWMGTYDFVPTKLVPTGYLKTSSDDWMADFTNTGVPAIAIGRIPVRTAEEA
ncbi:MAG: C25 family cysteine peptidase, partial [Thermoanaerobaculia bacterium]